MATVTKLLEAPEQVRRVIALGRTSSSFLKRLDIINERRSIDTANVRPVNSGLYCTGSYEDQDLAIAYGVDVFPFTDIKYDQDASVIGMFNHSRKWAYLFGIAKPEYTKRDVLSELEVVLKASFEHPALMDQFTFRNYEMFFDALMKNNQGCSMLWHDIDLLRNYCTESRIIKETFKKRDKTVYLLERKLY